MATTMRRITVSLPDDISNCLKRDCEGKKMQFSKKVVSIMREYYRMEIPHPMIFGRSQPISVESKHARPLVFRAAARPIEWPALDRRASPGQK